MRPNLFMLVWLLACLVSTPAYAEPVLFLHSEPRAVELYEALELELRGFGSVVALRPSPMGDSEPTRAASALAAARQVAAAASVWIASDSPLRVRVVHAASEGTVEAPLPAELAQLEARTFGAVAGSAVLEALGKRANAVAPPRPSLASAETPTPRASPGEEASSDVKRTAERLRARSVRPFVRLGGMLGAVLGREGSAPDRTPAPFINDIDRAARVAGVLDPETARDELLKRGFDCDTASSDDQLLVTNCSVALAPAGTIFVSAVELATGVQWSSYEFALTTRFSPTAGRGALAHWLLGAQVGRLLTPPNERGLWAEVVLGVGMGQIQARPAASRGASTGPFIRSGLGEAHLGALTGYRFLPELGLYGGVIGRAFMPDTLYVFDLSVGLEARL